MLKYLVGSCTIGCPCNHGLSKAFYSAYTFPFYLNGSCAMQQEATSKGIYNQIFISNSNGHGAFLQTPPLIDTVLQKTSNFLYNIICSNILSVDKIENKEALFQVYPNPVAETLNVEISTEPNNASINIYNELGQIVKSKTKINSQDTSIEIKDLTSGIYFMILQNNNKQMSRKFIINK